MEPSVAGFLIFGALVLLGYFLGAPIIIGLLASLPFGSTALVMFSALGGSTPLVYAGFVLLLLASVSLRRGFIDDLGVVFGYWTAWMVAALTLYVVFSAIVFPRLFAGRTSAFVVIPFGGVRELPLAPVSGNVTQTAYFVFGGLTFFAFAVLLIRVGNLEAMRRGFLTLVILHTAMGLIDLLAKLLGAGDVLLPIRSAGYALLIEEEAVGFWRIAGGYPEASAFAATTLTCLAYTFTYWRASRSPMSLVLAILQVFLLVFSTSTTAYVGLAVLSIFAATSLVAAALRGRASTQDIILISLVWIAIIVGLSIFLINETFFNPLVKLFETIVMDKMSSSSGEERSYWNWQSVQAFLDTGGVGIGMGSSRSSSWVISVFSQMGIVGGLMMLALVGVLLWDLVARKRVSVDTRFAPVAAGARAAALGSLVGPTIAGSGADPGVLFFIALAVVMTCRRSSSVLRHSEGLVNAGTR